MLSAFRQLSRLTIACEIAVSDCVSFCTTLFRSRTPLAAENLFLRKQLALFLERDKRAKPTTATVMKLTSKTTSGPQAFSQAVKSIG